MAVTSLPDLKRLFVKGLDYANERATFFIPANRGLTDFQKLAAQEAKDINEFMTAVMLTNSAWQNSFDRPLPLRDYAKATHFKFGEGDKEWYFIVGIFEEMAFVFCLFRLDIAAPAVVRTMFKDPSQAVVWNLWGGFGFRDTQTWTQFPFEWLQGPYQNRIGSSFSMALSNVAGDFKVDFAMTQNHIFEFTVAYGSTKLSATVTASGPPLPMAPHGCLFCGNYGLQSKYFSRSHCDVEATLNDRTFTDGHGWIDHQSFLVGQGDSTINNILGNSTRVIYKVQLAWLWMYVQDLTTDTYYMMYKAVRPDQFKSGKKYKLSCNIYKTKSMQFDVKGAELIVGPTSRYEDFDYPLEYHLTLPSKQKVILRASYGVGAFPNAARIDSWEVPAVLLLDSPEQEELGYGIVELNGVTPQKTQMQRVIKNLAPEALKTLQMK